MGADFGFQETGAGRVGRLAERLHDVLQGKSADWMAKRFRRFITDAEMTEGKSLQVNLNGTNLTESLEKIKDKKGRPVKSGAWVAGSWAQSEILGIGSQLELTWERGKGPKTSQEWMTVNCKSDDDKDWISGIIYLNSGRVYLEGVSRSEGLTDKDLTNLRSKKPVEVSARNHGLLLLELAALGVDSRIQSLGKSSGV